MLITKTMDTNAHLITKTITKRNNTKWFSPQLYTTKRKLRAAGKIWRKSKRSDDLLLFKQQSIIYIYIRMIINAKQAIIFTRVRLMEIILRNSLIYPTLYFSLLYHGVYTRILPDMPSKLIYFDTYFNNKLTNIIYSIPSLTIPPITISICKFNIFNTPTLTTIKKIRQTKSIEIPR